MLIFTVYHKGVKKQFDIYENKEEFEASGHQLKERLNAYPPCYILTDNGYYVPVHHIKKRTSKAGNTIVNISYAGGVWNNVWYKNKEEFRGGKYLMFYRDKPRLTTDQRLRPKDKAFLNLWMNSGNFDMSFNAVYTIRDPLNRQAEMNRILSNEATYLYLKENGGYEMLKDNFESAGMTKEWYAKYLKNTLEDMSQPAPLRVKALDIVKGQLEAKDNAQNVKGPKITVEDADKAQEAINQEVRKMVLGN